jgi:hypothetical protein
MKQFRLLAILSLLGGGTAVLHYGIRVNFPNKMGLHPHDSGNDSAV